MSYQGQDPTFNTVLARATSASNPYIMEKYFNSASASPAFISKRSRGSTINSHAALSNDDYCGRFLGQGSDGSAFISSSAIDFRVDGATSAGTVKGKIMFATRNSSSDFSYRFTIKSDGSMGFNTTAPITAYDFRPISSSSTSIIRHYSPNNDVNAISTFRAETLAGTLDISLQGITGVGGSTAFIKTSNADTTFSIKTGGSTDRLIILGTGLIGIGITPTARLTLPAGTATANTAPLKFTAGTSLAVLEDGTMEFDGANLFITIGGVRKTII